MGQGQARLAGQGGGLRSPQCWHNVCLGPTLPERAILVKVDGSTARFLLTEPGPVLEWFGDYFGGASGVPKAGNACIDRVIIKIIPANASRVAALLSGDPNRQLITDRLLSGRAVKLNSVMSPASSGWLNTNRLNE
jgi:hypothetical protein